MDFSIPKSDIFGNCFSLGTAWMPVPKVQKKSILGNSVVEHSPEGSGTGTT